MNRVILLTPFDNAAALGARTGWALLCLSLRVHFACAPLRCRSWKAARGNRRTNAQTSPPPPLPHHCSQAARSHEVMRSQVTLPTLTFFDSLHSSSTVYTAICRHSSSTVYTAICRQQHGKATAAAAHSHTRDYEHAASANTSFFQAAAEVEA